MGLSNIQWCDYTFNPWIGCRKVAPECKNCYAETLDINRFSKTMPGCSKEHPISHWGSGPRYRTSESNWREPMKWNRLALLRAAMSPGFYARPRVFCASLSDWLDDENVPSEWLRDLLSLIHETPNIDWLLLTKRPQNWKSRIEAALLSAQDDSGDDQPEWEWLEGWVCYDSPPENVWIGVSAGADQSAALAIPAKVHFLSCEPMLHDMDTTLARGFSWIIFGGESGKNARPCHTDWIRSGVEFCRENNIAPFVKQMGSNCYAAGGDQKYLIAMKDSHGGDMSEWPEDLRVREFPLTRTADRTP